MGKGKQDFRGKVVVVTGAASGIGKAIAEAFARRGATLALADIDAAGLERTREELEARGVPVGSWTVDVSDARQVERFCEDVYNRFGRVDVLCNNAGVATGGDFESHSLDDLQWVMGVNLVGVINGCHYFYPRMVAQGGGGHIVNTASVGGLAPFSGLAIYCCTKYAVVGLSETLRAEAAPHGIGVIALCPGVVSTDIVSHSRIVSGTKRSSPAEMAAKAEMRIKSRGCPPEKVGEAAVRAVERNRGVVLVTPEAYVLDAFHRASRRAFGFTMIMLAKLINRWM